MTRKPELVITFPGGKKVDADLGGRIIRTDQSRQAGGDSSAPEPFALFLASIGTCAGIYVLGFLQSRGLPTDDVQIKEQLDFDPVTGKLKGVDLEIEVPDSIPEKYHSALVRAADMCAVKKAIQNSPEFAVRVQPAQQKETSQTRDAAAA
jgi:ribosomal protein S12 methylthiotransferase accessory factor